MGKIKIVESVGGAVQDVHSYNDLEHHHPSNHLKESGRVYATIDGKREEVAGDYNGHIVKTRNGNMMVSKDFVLQDDNSGKPNLPIPAPASGYIGGINLKNGTVEIYDSPGGEIIARIRHMDLSTFALKNGDQIKYGEPMGKQSGFGKGIHDYYGTHTHMDFNVQYLDQFKKYINDIDKGLVTTNSYPQQSSNLTRAAVNSVPEHPLADGVLRRGEHGLEITALQTRLNALGFKDDRGNALVPDGDFGNSTKQAVAAFQRARHLDDDGIVGKDTFAALKQTTHTIQAPTPSAPIQTQTVAVTSALSNLIGSGEGSYNSYNRGVAGDSRTPINLSDMTIGEIMRRQDLSKTDPDHLFAVGKFQIIPSTMEATVKNLSLNGTEKYTPELQERMFADYLIDEKRPAVKAYITSDSIGPDALARAQLSLAKEFASVADPRTGNSYFNGDSAGNHSSITTTQVETALNRMRAQYQTNINNGLSPDAAYRALNGQAQGQTPATMQTTGALSDGILKKGEHGPEIAVLQTQLNALGFRDAKGNALAPDGDFGERTKQAVEAFQRSRDLVDDGVVGKDTLAALKKAETTSVAPPSQQVAPARNDQAPLLSHPNHPDHALYQQALTGIEKLPANTFKNELERQNAAASVAFEAKVSGLSRVDSVALSTNGSGLFAVQGAMSDPAHNRVYLDKAQAASQSVEKSTQQLQQESLLSVQAIQTQEHQKKSLVV